MGKKLITSPGKIADIFADHYAKILRDPHRKSEPKKKEEKPYNKPFTDRELMTTKEYNTW